MVLYVQHMQQQHAGPRNFSATAVSSTSVRLTWEPPASDCDVGITGYQVTYDVTVNVG